MREGVRDDVSIQLSEVESINVLNRGDGDLCSEGEGLTRRENPALFVFKLAVVSVLIVAAVALSVAAYYFTASAEENDFLSEYKGYATKIIDAYHEGSELRLWTAQSLSSNLAADMLLEGDRGWPFVTMTNFSRRIVSLGFIAKANSLLFAPIVTNETRQEWEQYAMENFDTLGGQSSQVSVQMDGTPSLPPSSSAYFYNLNAIKEECGDAYQPMYVEDGILSFAGKCTKASAVGEGPFFPIWQMAPWQPRHLMVDLMSYEFVADQLQALVEQRSPQISLTANTGTNDNFCCLLFPVFGGFSDDAPLVAVISLAFEWVAFFSNILPVNAVGMFLVLSNTCGQAYTFELNGPDVAFIGVGDLHDTKYDNHVFECEFGSKFNHSGSETAHFSEIDSTKDSCSRSSDHTFKEIMCKYSIRVYPSDHLRTTFITSNPAIFASVVVLIFVFTSIVFLAYDFLVERRQRFVLKTAARSNAIVQSLFPARFRDRVYTGRRDNETNAPLPLRRQNSVKLNSEPLSPFHPPAHPAMQSFDSSFQGDIRDDERAGKFRILSMLAETPKVRLKSYLFAPSTVTSSYDFESEPIAEMFTDTTIMFADISGFTAWSSEREPSQVFILLETLYKAFDTVAHRLGVFKVETIGDCYVAVAGLPDPNEHHAIVMTYFGYECIRQMKELVRELETTLGPGTSDLCMRVGLHSGPVTAGVLRGQKSRFQLFGDSVNTAARMESTGQPNLIHASQDTADLLVAAGKMSWVTAREDIVSVKGKGSMQTFWLKPRRGSAVPNTYLMDSSSNASSTIDSKPNHRTITQQHQFSHKTTLNRHSNESSSASSCSSQMANVQLDFDKWGNLSLDEALTVKAAVDDQKKVFQKRSRLVDWNVDLLLSFIAKIVADRDDDARSTRVGIGDIDHCGNNSRSRKILPEVTSVIILPDYDNKKRLRRQTEVVLPPEIREQLHDYVSRIAAMYRDIPFHNLEHASHVTMSAVKLMRRIINPDDIDSDCRGAGEQGNKTRSEEGARKQLDNLFYSNLHESTFGISSDPLTQFCVVFAALIHDVDHAGVPNSLLVKENAEVARKFGEKSCAEQNSLYIAWEMLMEPRYELLRSCIYTDEKERSRFRQLVVNTVMATDILDHELQLLRKKRWEAAFREESKTNSSSLSNFDRSRKATCVIEHIIQASDVAHTMQHWHIFKKWNERLFDEMYIAFKLGRSNQDPAIGWFEAQIGFFDNYIIPLAKKLKECGVFGVAGNEYLSYALENRREWEIKGREETEAMVFNFSFRHGFWSELHRQKCSGMILEEESGDPS